MEAVLKGNISLPSKMYQIATPSTIIISVINGMIGSYHQRYAHSAPSHQRHSWCVSRCGRHAVLHCEIYLSTRKVSALISA